MRFLFLPLFVLHTHIIKNNQNRKKRPTFPTKIKSSLLLLIFDNHGCASSCWSFWSKPQICSLKRRRAKSMMVGQIDDLLAGLASTI